MAEERQCVVVSACQVRRDLHPNAVGRANSRQHRCRGAGGVVAQRCRRPIVSHRVGTSHLVPKRELAAARRRRKCLGNVRVAIGRAGATDKRGVGAAVTAGDNRRRSS